MTVSAFGTVVIKAITLIEWNDECKRLLTTVEVVIGKKSSSGFSGLSELPGNGDGTFEGNFLTVFSFGALGHDIDIRVGDFNDDGKPDVALIPMDVILLGNGDGTFTLDATGTACDSCAFGDFTPDRKEDVVGTSGSGMESCLGSGNGTFGTCFSFDGLIEHKLVLPGNFNNDGNLDVIASDEHGMSVFLGNGDGTFQSAILTAVNATFPTFTVGDFNNDGKLDVAALTSSGVEVFLGKGDGTFEAPLVTPGVTSGNMTVTDLNKDGKLDLIVTNGGGITILLGKGNGTFAAPLHYALSAYTRAVVADFNGDGKLDVAVGAQGQVVDIFLGDGTGKLLTPPASFRVGGLPSGIVTADFTGDKKTDIGVAIGSEVVTLLHQ